VAGASGGESAAPEVDKALRSPGQPLDRATRALMESRFGQNFAHVRVHTDAGASRSAHNLGALAYTVGSDVVFAGGSYAPGSETGRSLLAHELTHVAQQAKGVVQRTPDPVALKEFDERVAKLKTHPAYLAAIKNFTARVQLRAIISEARARDDALYYITKLELLFDTPEEKAEKQAAEFSGRIAAATVAEGTRLGTEEGKSRAGREEAVSAEAGRVFEKRKGEGGKTFLIDARDPTNMAVRAKVRLRKAGKGTADDVARVKLLQDAIEKSASTLGYSVDLDFVDKDGPDVFTVNVDTSAWPTSGNWVNEAQTLGHELHHLLGLDDRYNYIESHAGNPKMKIPDRIHWFRQQMKKGPDPEGRKSIMGGRNLPMDDDVCRVAGKTGAALDECIKKRSDARRDKLQPAVSDAFGAMWRTYSTLTNITPINPAEDPAQRGLKEARAGQIADTLFGGTVDLPFAAQTVGDMRLAPSLPNLFFVSELNPQCSDKAFTVPIAPRIRLCPTFLELGKRDQADLLLREAAHFVGVSDSKSDMPCAGDCTTACGDSSNGNAWMRFVRCVSP